MGESDFGRFVRAVREEMDWTQAQMARALGVGTSTVSYWERGQSPRESTMGRVASYFSAPQPGKIRVIHEPKPGQKLFWGFMGAGVACSAGAVSLLILGGLSWM